MPLNDRWQHVQYEEDRANSRIDHWGASPIFITRLTLWSTVCVWHCTEVEKDEDWSGSVESSHSVVLVPTLWGVPFKEEGTSKEVGTPERHRYLRHGKRKLTQPKCNEKPPLVVKTCFVPLLLLSYIENRKGITAYSALGTFQTIRKRTLISFISPFAWV